MILYSSLSKTTTYCCCFITCSCEYGIHVHAAVPHVRWGLSLALMSLINKVLINDQGSCTGDRVSAGVMLTAGVLKGGAPAGTRNHNGLRAWLPEDVVSPKLPRVNPHVCMWLLPPPRKQCRTLRSTGLVLNLVQDWTMKCTLNSSGPRSCLRMLVISFFFFFFWVFWNLKIYWIFSFPNFLNFYSPSTLRVLQTP